LLQTPSRRSCHHEDRSGYRGQVNDARSSGLVAVAVHEDDHTYRRKKDAADQKGNLDIWKTERSYEGNNNTSQSQTYA